MADFRVRKASSGIVVGVALVGLGLGVYTGCGGDSAVRGSKLPDGVRSRTIEHEACNESGHKVEVLDANNDGKPDIKRVYKDGKEICRITDLNHDGKPDMFEYYDAAGQLRRREADYDDNGIVNAIEFYENGRIVRAELDTTNQGKIDTWDFYDAATGKRVKRERDATGDGKIDQWWTYEADRVTIAMDRNGDGLPDPDSTITLGANGQVVVPAIDAGAPPAALDAGPAAPPPPAPTPSPADLTPTSPTDAGAPGPAKRGGAKR